MSRIVSLLLVGGMGGEYRRQAPRRTSLHRWRGSFTRSPTTRTSDSLFAIELDRKELWKKQKEALISASSCKAGWDCDREILGESGVGESGGMITGCDSG
jgi:hypothetical protein